MRAVMLVFGLAVTSAQAQQVWSGYDYAFSKDAFADATQADNQDRITDSVWITRGNAQGLFNAVTQAAYSNLGPDDTEWAYGLAADWQNLTFAPWQTWASSNPPGTVGQDAVVHLITDDIYIDIRFTAWGQMSSSGGSFSYVRAAEPTCPADLTGEGDVNTNDFFAFLALYQAQDLGADFSPDGMINTNDFFAYLAAYQIGC